MRNGDRFAYQAERFATCRHRAHGPLADCMAIVSPSSTSRRPSQHDATSYRACRAGHLTTSGSAPAETATPATRPGQDGRPGPQDDKDEEGNSAAPPRPQPLSRHVTCSCGVPPWRSCGGSSAPGRAGGQPEPGRRLHRARSTRPAWLWRRRPAGTAGTPRQFPAPG